jgi:hypothetical protein
VELTVLHPIRARSFTPPENGYAQDDVLVRDNVCPVQTDSTA